MSWVDDTAEALGNLHSGLRPEQLRFVLKMAIEEAVRRCRAVEDACMEPGAALGAHRCARAIEATLEPEVKR